MAYGKGKRAGGMKGGSKGSQSSYYNPFGKGGKTYQASSSNQPTVKGGKKGK